MTRFNLDCPFLASGFCDSWLSRSWNTNKLAELLAEKTFHCRVSQINCERTMETDCVHHQISMKNFSEWLSGDSHQPNPLADFPRMKYCCYIDYKYMKDMFHDNPQIFSHVQWSSLGLPEFDGSDSTIWIGSEGANTPCHQDTYGFNLVTQIQGRKLWILFPPEDSQFLYPNRIPYEESSVFSAVNVRNPDMMAFPLLKKSHPVIVTLGPGQTLYVPRHWWHYVQSLEPSISVNVWVPVAGDNKSRYHEAITRTLASSLIRDFTDTDASGPARWLNPTETLAGSSINMKFLKTSLSHLLEDRESSKNKEKDFEALSPFHHTEMTSEPEDSVYLSKLASAMENYPSNQVSSPFELNGLKRQASVKEFSNKGIKKPKLSSDCEILPSGMLLEGDRESMDDVQRRYPSKKLYSLDSCSVDVYLKYMRDLCDKSTCSCKRNRQKCEVNVISSDIAPVSHQRQAEWENSHQTVYSNINDCKSKIQDASCSFISAAINREERNWNILSCQDKSSTDKHTVSLQPGVLNINDKSSLSCAATKSSSKKVEQHCEAMTIDVMRPGLLNQNLTRSEFAEAFLKSILQPDIIQAVSVKLREQCDTLLRRKK